MRVSRRVYFGASLAAAIVLVLGARDAGAYTAYTASPDNGNCFTCHGDFNCDQDCDGTDAHRFKIDFGRSGLKNPCPACVVGEWCVYE